MVEHGFPYMKSSLDSQTEVLPIINYRKICRIEIIRSSRQPTGQVNLGDYLTAYKGININSELQDTM